MRVVWFVVATVLVASLLVVGPASALPYSKRSGVITLDASTFKSSVLEDTDNLWVVEFYAPWCGHCKALAPEYRKAAKALKSIAKLGAVDCDTEKELAGKYGVKGFPTIKIFGPETKRSPTDYQGQRTAQGLVNGVLEAFRNVANKRLGGRGGGSGTAAGGGGGGGSSSSGGTDEFGYGQSASVQLSDANFDSTVMASKQAWLVEFYAPWCGHCKALAPEWIRAANELSGKFNLGAVDATQHQMVAQRYGVRGYPTIKYFPPGDKSATPEDYTGGRTAADINTWAMQKLQASGWEPDVEEWNGPETFEASCGKGGTICVLAVLPDIRDTGKDGREAIVKKVKEVAKKSQGPYVYGWVAAGAQPGLEQQFDMTAGFPAIALLNHGKKVYSVFTGAFEVKKLARWVNARGGGSMGRRGKVQGWATFESTTAWDGSEPEQIEEEFSLADLMGDDDL